MERLTGKLVSIPTLWRALKHLGMTRKKVKILILFYIGYLIIKLL